MPEGTGFGRILLVDDENDVRELVADILKNAGYAVTTARDGLEGVEIARREGASISMVVTDVMMPGLDGGAMARQIQDLRPGIPIVFMSGYPPEVLAERGMLPRGAPRLEKPFGVADLLREVKRALGER